MKSTSNKLVQQSNKLIETSQSLTVIERRLIYHILSRLNPQDKKQSYTVKIEDFANDFPQMGKGTIYNQVKDAIEKLWKREIVFIDKDEKVTKIRWFSSQQYQDKQAFLKISFSNEVMSLIFDLKQQYTSMLLENFKNLDSVYSLRLYELLCQYKTIGKREITVEDLRFFLDCVETNKEFKFFKLRVIEPAIEEINARTNLLINKVEYKRNGRKINSIKFEFCDKSFIQETTTTETTKPKQKTMKINDEPSLKRYPRVRKVDHSGYIEDCELNDTEKLEYAMEWYKEQHKNIFNIACHNLKIISDYQKEENKLLSRELSSRLLHAKKRAQQTIGLYYANPDEYEFTVEELNKIKEEIFFTEEEEDKEV